MVVFSVVFTVGNSGGGDGGELVVVMLATF